MRRFTGGFEVQGNPASGLVIGTPTSITGLAGPVGTSVRALHCPPSGNRVSDASCYAHCDGGAGTYGRTYFYRARIRKTGTPASGKGLFMIRNHTSGEQVNGYVSVRLNDDNTLSLVTSTTAADAVQVGSRSAPIADGDVHLIEMMVRPISLGVVDCALRVDRSLVTSASSVTATGLDKSTEVDFGRVGQTNTASTPVLYPWVDTANVTIDVDDCAINDDLVPTGQTAGTLGAQDSYAGEGVVFSLKPTADSANTGWQTGAGGTTNLWDAVNNDPPVGVAAGSATATSQIKTTVDGAYRAAVETLNARGLSGTVVVVQPAANIGQQSIFSSAVGLPLYLESFSNPAGSEGQYTTQTLVAGTYPANWAPFMGPAVHLPAMDPGVAAVVQLRSKGLSGSGLTAMADFLGLTVELTTPAVRRSLTMIV